MTDTPSPQELAAYPADLTELKPCPFCGGRPVRHTTLRDGRTDNDVEAYAYTVSCISCAAEGGWAKTLSGGDRWWNTRPALEAGAADTARLKRMAQRACLETFNGVGMIVVRVPNVSGLTFRECIDRDIAAIEAEAPNA